MSYVCTNGREKSVRRIVRGRRCPGVILCAGTSVWLPTNHVWVLLGAVAGKEKATASWLYNRGRNTISKLFPGRRKLDRRHPTMNTARRNDTETKIMCMQNRKILSRTYFLYKRTYKYTYLLFFIVFCVALVLWAHACMK